MHPVLESVLALFHHEIVGHIDVTKSKHDHQQRACPYTDVTKDMMPVADVLAPVTLFTAATTA